MTKEINIIFEGEIFNTIKYLQRLFIVTDQIEKLSATDPIKKISANLYYELYENVLPQIAPPEMRLEDENESLLILNSSKIFFHTFDLANLLAQQFICMLKLPLQQKVVHAKIIKFLDTILSSCYELHRFLTEQGNIKIEYPRSQFIESMQPSNSNSTLLFKIDQKRLKEVAEEQLENINSLATQRLKKYQHHLQQGHKCNMHRDFKRALAEFQRAALYQNSAEVQTLIGWVHAQLGNLEKAKKCCLEAIKIDRNYGAAYNDLGSYLMSEQKFDEALKWLNMAKQATNYQNREFPYINTSKIFMGLNRYEEALNELLMAQKLTPFPQPELQQMIEKLQHLLQNKERPKSNFNPRIVT